MALLGFAIAAVVIGLGVAAGRWLASRAFGIRGTFREMVDTGAERGRPALAFARALASLAGMYLACVLLFVPGFAGDVQEIDETSMRVRVSPDGPAARAGIVDGDRILSVDGEAATDWPTLKRLVASHPDETISVDVDRGGERKTFSVTTSGPKMLVGPAIEHRSLSAGEILARSFAAPFEVVAAVARGLARTFSGAEKAELSGPVGVSREMTAASTAGAGSFFRLLAALAAYQASFVGMVLLTVAFFMGFAAKRRLEASGNPS